MNAGQGGAWLQASTGGYYTTDLLVETASLIVSNSTIAGSGGNDVEVLNSALAIFRDDTFGPVPSGRYALVNDGWASGDLSIDATGNWWGAASGPSGSGLAGTGVPVSFGVFVSPWLCAPLSTVPNSFCGAPSSSVAVARASSLPASGNVTPTPTASLPGVAATPTIARGTPAASGIAGALATVGQWVRSIFGAVTGESRSPAAVATSPMPPIQITRTGFSPASVTVTAGTAVEWYNGTDTTVTLVAGPIDHVYLPVVVNQARDLSIAGGSATSVAVPSSPPAGSASGISSAATVGCGGPIAPGQFLSCTFTTPGTYPFHLAGMVQFASEVVVLPAPTSTATATTAVTNTPTPTATVPPTATPTATATATGSPVIPPTPAVPPPNPATVAPTVNPSSGATTLFSTTQFLYTYQGGSQPIQGGVAPNTIQPQQVAVIRGRVRDTAGTPLAGVRITILNHPEFGSTLSRTDGGYDLAVNGGGLLTVVYALSGYPTVQRPVNVPWQDYVSVPDVVLTPLDPNVTVIDLTAAQPFQVAQGSVISDTDGMRQATLLFPVGETATLVFANGSTQPLTPTLHVRATEFTVGASGPSAMPGQLPPTTGYTYATQFSIDEATQAGATSVSFSQPVIEYTQNFLNFPVGELVPVGYYDQTKGEWVPAANGRVVRLLSVSNGAANLDVDGQGQLATAAEYQSLGISDAERQELASLYTVGQSLWRVPLAHLSIWDYNWGVGPPQGATAPNQPPPEANPELDDNAVTGQACHVPAHSTITCQNQTLGEDLGIAGTGFVLHYSSDRVPGRTAANSLVIPLSGTSLPPGLKRIDLEVSVAGQDSVQSFPPQPNQSYTFTWNGQDAYGRTLQGSQPVTIKLGYVYTATYLSPSQIAGLTSPAFGHFTYFGAPATGSANRTEVTVWQEEKGTVGGTTLGAWDARGAGLGGWTLNVQPFYDPVGRVLSLGDGERVSTNVSSVNHVLASVLTLGPGTDPRGLAAASDGSLYIAASGEHEVLKWTAGGAVTVVAGTGVAGFAGDGGPATAAQLDWPVGLALGPDGSLYIADAGNNRIRVVAPNGTITTFAGNGVAGFAGDGGPASQAKLHDPEGVAVGPDGTVYVADTGNDRIRAVTADGTIVTAVGTGVYGFSGDGGPAPQAALARPVALAVDARGDLFLVDQQNERIREVTPDGTIRTVAGNGSWGFGGDGGPATQAQLNFPVNIPVAPEGTLYLADFLNNRIRYIDQRGTITSVAGEGWCASSQSYCASGEGGPPLQALLNGPSSVAVAPDGTFYLADGFDGVIRRVAAPLPGYSAADLAVPSPDGSELYRFDPSGKILQTLNTLTGSVKYTFGYDSNGRLISVTDANGNVTTIQRDSNGNPTAVVAPFGQTTTVTLDSNGFLASVTDPEGNTTRMTYTVGGLLTSLTDPNGNTSTYSYDSLGRLTADQGPAGDTLSLGRLESTNGYTVTLTTTLGRTTNYQVQNLPSGDQRFVNTDSAGLQDTSRVSANGTNQMTFPDGSTTNLVEGPDPRFGMQAPLPASGVGTRPSGVQATFATSSAVMLADPTNPLSLTSETDTTTVNGQAYTSSYSATSQMVTDTSPAGRQVMTEIDAQERPVQIQISGLAPISIAYNGQGRVTSFAQGTGTNARSYGVAYDAAGNVSSLTDPLGETTRFAYNADGQTMSETLANGAQFRFAYDANGNLISVTPPDQPAYQFTYTADNLPASYTLPSAGSGNVTTTYSYNADRQLSQVTRPDGTTIGYGYDSAGRLAAITLPTGQIGYSYDSRTGNVSQVSGPMTETVSYGYDGTLLTSEAWSGVITGTVGYTYDANDWLTVETVDGANQITAQYDADGYLTQVGSLSIQNDARNGLLLGTTLGSVVTSNGYDSFGDRTSYSATYNSGPLIADQYTYDSLGRI
ncbi:MAG TPA: hypothetical protein VKY56_07395, partial [Chloroflexota bacterium]|nr:hypothetical protein [Chloroflexota bacterium]